MDYRMMQRRNGVWMETEHRFPYPQKATFIISSQCNPLSALSTSKPGNQEHKEPGGGSIIRPLP